MSDEQGKQPTIFLVEEDDVTRRPLVSNLRGYGYRVIVAVDEEDALERVGGGGVDADLMLVNLVGKTAGEVLSLGRRVREHAKYDGHTPLVVMPEKYGKDVEGTDVNVEGNDWILYLGEQADQLKNLLRRLVPPGTGGGGQSPRTGPTSSSKEV
jgi:CheY-like chemotaxis protein